MRCGGILKPDVVMFGDNVPTETVDLVYRKVNGELIEIVVCVCVCVCVGPGLTMV